MGNFKFQVNIGGIIDLLSQHLYSSPKVFVRELLQNAVDAITARNMSGASGDAEILFELVDKGEYREIHVTDTGTGLTLEGIHKFLSVIGESSKRDNLLNTDFIGRFGIGLLSGFLISDEIILHTRSADSNKGYIWRGKYDGVYQIEESDRHQVGSTVILKSKPDTEEYYEADFLFDTLSYYGDILPYPVHFKAMDRPVVQINDITPAWLVPLSSSPIDVLAYGEDYFGESFMGFIPLKAKSGDLEGVAYILNRRVNPGIRNNHRVYLRNMLLTETGKGLLPDWAFFVKVIVNSDTLRPTASREDFYEDDNLYKTQTEIGESIKSFLRNLSETDPVMMDEFMREHHLALKALAIDDEGILESFLDYFMFETSLGSYTFKEIKESTDTIKYVATVDEFRQMSAVFGSVNQLLVNAGYVYDNDLMEEAARKYSDIFFERLTPEDAVFAMEELSGNESDYFNKLVVTAGVNLERWNCRVEIKKFYPEELPCILLAGEEALFVDDLRFAKENSNDLFASLLDKFDRSSDVHSMVLCFNANNKLVRNLAAKPDCDPCVFDLLYVQSVLLARRPLRKKEMAALNNGILSLIQLAF